MAENARFGSVVHFLFTVIDTRGRPVLSTIVGLWSRYVGAWQVRLLSSHPECASANTMYTHHIHSASSPLISTPVCSRLEKLCVDMLGSAANDFKLEGLEVPARSPISRYLDDPLSPPAELDGVPPSNMTVKSFGTAIIGLQPRSNCTGSWSAGDVNCRPSPVTTSHVLLPFPCGAPTPWRASESLANIFLLHASCEAGTCLRPIVSSGPDAESLVDVDAGFSWMYWVRDHAGIGTCNLQSGDDVQLLDYHAFVERKLESHQIYNILPTSSTDADNLLVTDEVTYVAFVSAISYRVGANYSIDTLATSTVAAGDAQVLATIQSQPKDFLFGTHMDALDGSFVFNIVNRHGAIAPGPSLACQFHVYSFFNLQCFAATSTIESVAMVSPETVVMGMPYADTPSSERVGRVVAWSTLANNATTIAYDYYTRTRGLQYGTTLSAGPVTNETVCLLAGAAGIGGQFYNCYTLPSWTRVDGQADVQLTGPLRHLASRSVVSYGNSLFLELDNLTTGHPSLGIYGTSERNLSSTSATQFSTILAGCELPRTQLRNHVWVPCRDAASNVTTMREIDADGQVTGRVASWSHGRWTPVVRSLSGSDIILLHYRSLNLSIVWSTPKSSTLAVLASIHLETAPLLWGATARLELDQLRPVAHATGIFCGVGAVNLTLHSRSGSVDGHVYEADDAWGTNAQLRETLSIDEADSSSILIWPMEGGVRHLHLVVQSSSGYTAEVDANLACSPEINPATNTIRRPSVKEGLTHWWWTGATEVALSATAGLPLWRTSPSLPWRYMRFNLLRFFQSVSLSEVQFVGQAWVAHARLIFLLGRYEPLGSPAVQSVLFRAWQSDYGWLVVEMTSLGSTSASRAAVMPMTIPSDVLQPVTLALQYNAQITVYRATHDGQSLEVRGTFATNGLSLVSQDVSSGFVALSSDAVGGRLRVQFVNLTWPNASTTYNLSADAQLVLGTFTLNSTLSGIAMMLASIGDDGVGRITVTLQDAPSGLVHLTSTVPGYYRGATMLNDGAYVLVQPSNLIPLLLVYEISLLRPTRVVHALAQSLTSTQLHATPNGGLTLKGTPSQGGLVCQIIDPLPSESPAFATLPCTQGFMTASVFPQLLMLEQPQTFTFCSNSLATELLLSTIGVSVLRFAPSESSPGFWGAELVCLALSGAYEYIDLGCDGSACEVELPLCVGSTKGVHIWGPAQEWSLTVTSLYSPCKEQSTWSAMPEPSSNCSLLLEDLDGTTTRFCHVNNTAVGIEHASLVLPGSVHNLASETTSHACAAVWHDLAYLAVSNAGTQLQLHRIALDGRTTTTTSFRAAFDCLKCTLLPADANVFFFLCHTALVGRSIMWELHWWSNETTQVIFRETNVAQAVLDAERLLVVLQNLDGSTAVHVGLFRETAGPSRVSLGPSLRNETLLPIAELRSGQLYTTSWNVVSQTYQVMQWHIDANWDLEFTASWSTGPLRPTAMVVSANHVFVMAHDTLLAFPLSETATSCLGLTVPDFVLSLRTAGAALVVETNGTTSAWRVPALPSTMNGINVSCTVNLTGDGATYNHDGGSVTLCLPNLCAALRLTLLFDQPPGDFEVRVALETEGSSARFWPSGASTFTGNMLIPTNARSLAMAHVYNPYRYPFHILRSDRAVHETTCNTQPWSRRTQCSLCTAAKLDLFEQFDCQLESATCRLVSTTGHASQGRFNFIDSTTTVRVEASEPSVTLYPLSDALHVHALPLLLPEGCYSTAPVLFVPGFTSTEYISVFTVDAVGAVRLRVNDLAVNLVCNTSRLSAAKLMFYPGGAAESASGTLLEMTTTAAHADAQLGTCLPPVNATSTSHRYIGAEFLAVADIEPAKFGVWVLSYLLSFDGSITSVEVRSDDNQLLAFGQDSGTGTVRLEVLFDSDTTSSFTFYTRGVGTLVLTPISEQQVLSYGPTRFCDCFAYPSCDLDEHLLLDVINSSGSCETCAAGSLVDMGVGLSCTVPWSEQAYALPTDGTLLDLNMGILSSPIALLHIGSWPQLRILSNAAAPPSLDLHLQGSNFQGQILSTSEYLVVWLRSDKATGLYFLTVNETHIQYGKDRSDLDSPDQARRFDASSNAVYISITRSVQTAFCILPTPGNALVPDYNCVLTDVASDVYVAPGTDLVLLVNQQEVLVLNCSVAPLLCWQRLALSLPPSTPNITTAALSTQYAVVACTDMRAAVPAAVLIVSALQGSGTQDPEPGAFALTGCQSVSSVRFYEHLPTQAVVACQTGPGSVGVFHLDLSTHARTPWLWMQNTSRLWLPSSAYVLSDGHHIYTFQNNTWLQAMNTTALQDAADKGTVMYSRRIFLGEVTTTSTRAATSSVAVTSPPVQSTRAKSVSTPLSVDASSSDSANGVIIGAAVAGVALVLIIVLLMLKFRRRIKPLHSSGASGPACHRSLLELQMSDVKAVMMEVALMNHVCQHPNIVGIEAVVHDTCVLHAHSHPTT
ncbi:uncharacterized protein MONBRDRAFT_10010 [Monosiga brevicollis MX1]|uniref:Uncharacterized protein n=1 Tax=Monosiga brevicollis TaxID=81824 RepID=A9V4X7_MONBE|nr:uncharacterized protein MONBRDRAFT_10010 [Monosiga brevicollis MX1]EDQ87448.1 predicted protein [Monosiga brevicollis MX1]|eukprot:XP_001747708.1 hypothetical protein [Monosiga brevicollis MX1]